MFRHYPPKPYLVASKPDVKSKPHQPPRQLRLLSTRKLPHVDETTMVQLLKQGNRKAQQALYESYSPLLFGLVRRYVKNTTDAEDVLVEGFFKIMTKIEQYQGQGSFEGWMKRIMVNEALMHLRKRHNFHLTLEVADHDAPKDPTIEQELAAEDILNLLDTLPTGYRTVFNLYVVEGYKHREIAEILGISINTSKSQLILAKKKLGALVTEAHQIRIEDRP